MKKRKQILVFDDDYERTERWSDELRKLSYIDRDFEIISMTIDEFKETVDELLRRRSETEEKGSYEPNGLPLDKTTIFMLDATLINRDEKIHTSGSFTAYLARCFSECLYFIGVNQSPGVFPGGNTFDLTMKGHPELFYDLQLGDAQLANKGLWDQDFEGFRPWYWPILSRSVQNFEKRVAEVRSNFEKPISEVLGFSDEINYFPDSVNNFLGGLGGKPTTITFKDFVLTSENGIKIQDKLLQEENITRFAAARISTWLEYVVLQRQDILIDAPHLVTRYPSLLKGDHGDIEVWNSTVKFGNYNELDLDHSKIDKYRFKKDYWLSRPAWYLGDLSEDEGILEVADPWKKVEVNFRFSEDSSKFLPKDECNRFESDFDSIYKRRYIKKDRYEDVEYRPRYKLLNLT